MKEEEGEGRREGGEELGREGRAGRKSCVIPNKQKKVENNKSSPITSNGRGEGGGGGKGDIRGGGGAGCHQVPEESYIWHCTTTFTTRHHHHHTVASLSTLKLPQWKEGLRLRGWWCAARLLQS